MKLNHVNLYSVDVPADRALFETYFGLRCIHAQGDTLAVMRDDGDMVFVINRFGKPDGFAYPESFIKHHVGFIQTSREDVDAVHARLRADGVDVQQPRDFHGAWTFYFKAPGGYYVEVATQTQLHRS